MKTVYFIIAIVVACLAWEAYTLFTAQATISDVMVKAGDRWPLVIGIWFLLAAHWWWGHKKK